MNNNYTILRATNKELRDQTKEFIDTYHSYIKWQNRPSRRLYWLLYEDKILVGVFALASAFSNPKDVKNFMNTNNIEFNELANNIVYCLANCRNKNAGTIFLKMCRQDAIKWWYERYGDKLKAFQTFILPPRTGAIYKADNWIKIGKTSGYSRKTITITEEEAFDENSNRNKGVRIKKFSDGSVCYKIQEDIKTDPKLIFMKLNSQKELNKILK